MTAIIPYSNVLIAMSSIGAICNYHNSGSFGLSGDNVQTVGWLTDDDPTIRPEMRQHSRLFSRDELIPRLLQIWQKHLPGPIWIMPASHWAFELNYGNADWLPQRLSEIGIDPSLLRDRNDGSAIAFDWTERNAVTDLTADLLTRSTASDFTATWPTHATVAMLHHHRQIWWRTMELELADDLRLISPSIAVD